MKSFITFFAASSLFGDKSFAFILYETSSAKTISIQDFDVLDFVELIFGFAKISM